MRVLGPAILAMTLLVPRLSSRMAGAIGVELVGDDRLGGEALLSEQFAHRRISVTMPKPRTRPSLRPGTRPFSRL